MTDPQLELSAPSAAPDDAIVIRPATVADRDFVVSLDDRLIAEAVVPDISREKLVAFQSHYTGVALSGGKAGGATLVAVDGAERPLGYIHLEPHEDTLAGATSGYVSILAVTAGAEGRGVATRLMAAAEAWAVDRGYRFLLLDVFASNESARRFYARRGFTDESLRLRRSIGG